MEKDSCRFCNSELSHVFVDLGNTPLANSFLDESDLEKNELTIPLIAYVCGNCFLVQLTESSSPKEIFSDYAYFSSYSSTWLKHAQNYVQMMLEHYNFDLLNIPKDHPARDQWDTIWLDRPNRDDNLLRTHTSPMQARIMENSKPPIRVIVPGKCYRYEATDSTHEWHFHQIEGLVVGKNISFSDLKGTLYELARRIFGPTRKVRFRCDFFPFVEPGVDMSIDWKGEWIEILGAGMVHPKVFGGVGYDQNVYSGFAFGMGPERIAMSRDDIEDIRQFFSNDLRFLSQF